MVYASSEDGRLAVIGMSYRSRDGETANSAIIATVTPADFKSSHPLAGIEFQRSLEEKAWKAGNGKVPVQRLEDYLQNRKSTRSVPSRQGQTFRRKVSKFFALLFVLYKK